MATVVQCPKCERVSFAPEDFLGQRVRCKSCGERFRVAVASLPKAVGRYQVRELMRAGPFAVTYRAFDPQQGRDVSLTMLYREALGGGAEEQRFLREVMVVAQVRHPHIAPVFHATREGTNYIVTASVPDGRTLASLIPTGGLEPRRAAGLALQLAEALAYAHDRGVSHREVTLFSLVVDDRDNLALTDLGVAAWTNRAQDGAAAANGAAAKDGLAADVYAAGAVLYEMLTGSAPAGRPAPPSRLRPGLDPALDALCLKTLAPPEQRCRSAHELAAGLRRWLAGEPTPALSPRPAVADVPTTQWDGIQAPRAPASLGAKGLRTPPAPTLRPPEVPPFDLPPVIPAVAPRPAPPARPPAAPPGRKRAWLVPAAVGAAALAVAAGTFAILIAFWPARPTVADPPPPSLIGRVGGIEIGSKGVKATVVELMTDPVYSYDLKLLAVGKPENTTLVSGLGKNEQFDDQALAATVTAVNQFLSEMKDKYDIPPEKVHIIASSGVFSPLRGKDDRVKDAQKQLTEAVRGKTGMTMTCIDVEREVALTIEGAVPRKHMDEALLIDVGSGNTKGGYREPSGRFVTFSANYGTTTFTEAVKAKVQQTKAAFAQEAAALRGQLLEPALKAEADKEHKFGLRNRDRVYLSGGIVWALATLRRPADRGQFVELTPADIDELQAMLANAPGDALPEPTLGNNVTREVREAAEKDLKDLRGAFKKENLVAGAEILQSLSKELRFKEKKLYFARYGYIGWLLSYVAEEGNKAR